MWTSARRTMLLAVIAAAAASPRNGNAAEDLRTISTTGQGEVSAPPDMATIETGIVSQAASAKDALKANNAAMEKVLQVLKEHHVAEKDIQTVDFSVSPVYKRDERNTQPPEVVAYQVQNRVRVRVRKLADLGDVLDALVQAGSNGILGISFGVDDATGILNQARSRAVRDAQATPMSMHRPQAFASGVSARSASKREAARIRCT